MKLVQNPELIELEAKLEAASYRRTEALILLDHAIETQNHVTAKIARNALDRAGADVSAIQSLLNRVKHEYRFPRR